MNDRDHLYWTERWEQGQTGWDIGFVSPPLQEYCDQLGNKNLSILIPGAGNGYEAEYLHKQGFADVTVLDISQIPLNQLKQRIPEYPEEKLVLGDFFTHQGAYDLILEQTFFSAIHPNQRTSYVQQMSNLLKPGGRLAGVLWGVPMRTDGPPYGGSIELYGDLFGATFEIRVLEDCNNSIPQRQGTEVFINFKKPIN